jgi:hypothetical protein
MDKRMASKDSTAAAAGASANDHRYNQQVINSLYPHGVFFVMM